MDQRFGGQAGPIARRGQRPVGWGSQLEQLEIPRRHSGSLHRPCGWRHSAARRPGATRHPPGMTVIVVHLLEVIDIAQNDGDTVAAVAETREGSHCRKSRIMPGSRARSARRAWPSSAFPHALRPDGLPAVDALSSPYRARSCNQDGSISWRDAFLMIRHVSVHDFLRRSQTAVKGHSKHWSVAISGGAGENRTHA